MIADILAELCRLDGVSGNESQVRKFIHDRLESRADEITVDKLGNLLVYKRGLNRAKEKLMLAAHMDEVGLVVKYITGAGYLKFGCVGGIDRRVLLGKRVLIGDNRVPGVIALKAFHLSAASERAVVPKLDDLYIDIGASSAEDAGKMVNIGDSVVFDSVFWRFGDGYIKSRAIDDRLGCAVLIKLIEETPPSDAWFAFTVQEEIGLRGANVAANILRPDTAIIVEATTAADSPDAPEHCRICRLKGGAAVPFMDRATIYDKELVSGIWDLASAKGIPYQTKNFVSGGTDAAAIQRCGKGVKVAAISAPVRNIHSPSCVAAISDCEAVLNLTREFLLSRADTGGDNAKSI